VDFLHACFRGALLGDLFLHGGFQHPQARAADLGVVFQRRPLQGEQVGLKLALLDFQLLVPFGRVGLAFQTGQVTADLVAQVGQAIEVLAGMLDAALGLPATLLVARYAGGLLEVRTDFLGACVNHLGDHALFDDRVALRADTGAEEQVAHVLAPAAGAVQRVRRDAVPADGAFDRHLVEGGELTGDAAAGIVEYQFDAGGAHRLTAG